MFFANCRIRIQLLSQQSGEGHRDESWNRVALGDNIIYFDKKTE